MSNQARQPDFQRNSSLEELLSELNTLLCVAESNIPDLQERPRYPIIFVVGAPRSGTTLLMQWLAATGAFAYPSNLLSRFYSAPYIGARIQQLLTDPKFNYQDELGDLAAYQAPFTSRVGKTKGVLQPNEFWYFWRRFIPNIDPEWITPEQEAQIDAEGMLAGFAALEAAFDKPFATKSIILQYNLACLQKILGDVVFIHTVRDPFFNTQSLLNARRDYYGDERVWFSVKPREYSRLKELDPVTQVAGQVYYTQRSIEKELSSLGPRHGISVRHEDFCKSPVTFYNSLRDHLADMGYKLPEQYTGPESFKVHDQVRVDSVIRGRIVNALESLSRE